MRIIGTTSNKLQQNSFLQECIQERSLKSVKQVQLYMMNITKKSNNQFSHFFHKNNHNSRTKKDYIIDYTLIYGKLSRLQSI